MVNFRSLDLNLLRLFDTLMNEGSLTRAAEALAITQPAASHALRRLHDAVGEPLFQRAAGGMAPTARAQALWPRVHAALAELEQVLAPRQFDPQADRQLFRLTMPDAVAAMLAPAMVEVLQRERVLSNLRLMPLITRDPRELLHEGQTDLAIGHFPGVKSLVDGTEETPSLRHEVLHRTGFVVVMRAGHPLAEGELTLDRFAEAPQMLLSLGGRSRGAVDEVLAGLGRSRRVVLTVNQYQTAGRVLAHSDLITVLPLALMPAVGWRERLVTRPLPLQLAPLDVEMMWLARRDAEPAQRWLRELVRRCARFGDEAVGGD